MIAMVTLITLIISNNLIIANWTEPHLGEIVRPHEVLHVSTLSNPYYLKLYAAAISNKTLRHECHYLWESSCL